MRNHLATTAITVFCIGLLPAEDRRAQRASLIMAGLQRATLAEVERDGFRVLTHRTSLTPSQLR